MTHAFALACATILTALTLATRGDAQPADLILRGGRIVTVDGNWRTAEAVAVRDGRFVAVGDNATIAALAGPATQVIDLGGRTVVPGLIDTHLHQMLSGLNSRGVQLLGARSVADVQRAVAERVAQTPPGQWVTASSGWHESILAEGRMVTRWELDQVAPEHPVFIPRGGHVVTVSSKALALAGITRDTPNPDGGIIVKDERGEPTGVLLQNAANLVRRILPPPPPPPAAAELLKRAMRELNSFGIVGVVEPGVDERVMALYRQVHDAGEMTVRTDVLYRAATKAQMEKGIAAVRAQPSSDMLRFPGIKVPLDGGVEGGRMYWPYRIVPGEQSDPAYRGVLLLPPGGEDEYVEALKLVAAAGLQVQTHAVGDETIDVIVRAYERVDRERPIRDLRWAIMHIFHPSDAAIRKMAQIGIVATVQDHPVLLGHNQRRWWGDERAAYAIPIRKLLDAGILLGGGSDGPVVPVDPFLSMWWMTTRQVLKGYRLGPEHAITAREALKLYTIDNARILGVQNERGSIEPGKLADLVVLSQDILAVPPDSIRDTKALLTVLGGRIVHRAGI
jgi:predicted amidohydrolase YtcJ